VIAEICCNNQFEEPPIPKDRGKQSQICKQLINELPLQDQNESKILVEDIGRSSMLTFLQRRLFAFDIVQKQVPILKKLVEECLHIAEKQRWEFNEIVGELMSVDSTLGDQTKPNIAKFVNQWALVSTSQKPVSNTMVQPCVKINIQPTEQIKKDMSDQFELHLRKEPGFENHN